jgi:hypothetical protein
VLRAWQPSTGQNPYYETFTNSTTSLYDGATNTATLADGAHPAADYCANLVVNGYSDWYLPSRYEWDIIYSNLKPEDTPNSSISYDNNVGINAYSILPRTTNYRSNVPWTTYADGFKYGGSEALNGDFYWTSSQYNVVDANSQYNRAIYIALSGTTATLSKSDSIDVRAIRKVPIFYTQTHVSYTYRYWRWYITSTLGQDCWVGQFKFQVNGVDVDQLVSAVTMTLPGGSTNTASDPYRVIANSGGGLYNDWAFENYLHGTAGYTDIRFDFGTAKTFTGYRWMTSYGVPDYDPRSWVLQGSTNGTTWTTLDTVTNFSPTAARNTWQTAFLGVAVPGTPTTTTTTTTTAAPTTTTTSTSTTTTTASPGTSLTVEYDVIAGGGAGGMGGYAAGSTTLQGSGGGAGGFLSGSAAKVTGTAYNISVGAGGASAASSAVQGSNGTNSYFDSHTATGGGRGGRYGIGGSGGIGADGGSGGGGAGAAAGNGIGGQGYAGRQWAQPGYSQSVASGGGGGAGGQPPATYPNTPWTSGSGEGCVIDGGPGRTSTLTGGTYGGGGAGGYYLNTASRRPGGSGGGGSGGIGNTDTGRSGDNGGTNTGGGGGGGSWGSTTPSLVIGYGGSGGSGVIFLKIPDTYTASFSAGISSGGGGASGGYRVYGVYSGTGTVTFT